MSYQVAARPHPWWSLVGWVIVCGIAGAIGSIASLDAGTFYASLERPAWAPPAAVFGPVWTALYLIMAVAAWLVWRSPRDSSLRTTALLLFVVQLGLNALWSWLFFAWHLGGAAFFEVAVLWLMIVATTVYFWRINRIAGALLLPYLLWVTFASVLTWSVWRANPAVLG